jgi:hypothetical protein
VADTGYVGIGTTNPSYPLIVQGDTADDVLASFNGYNSLRSRVIIGAFAAADADASISFAQDTGSEWSIGFDDSDSDKFKIAHHPYIDTNTRLTIDETGNVGIGTTIPRKLLDVRSTATADFALAVRGDIDHSGNWTGIRFDTIGPEAMYIRNSG